MQKFFTKLKEMWIEQQNRDGVVKLFNLFGRFSLFVIVSTLTLFAGSFEDFKRTQNRAYTSFKDPRDNGFSSYLKSQWKEYEAYITPSMFSKPKPQNINPLPQKPAPKVGPLVLVEIPHQKSLQQLPQTLLKPEVRYDILLPFFGLELGFTKDKKIVAYKFYPHSQAGIAAVFSALASSDYEGVLHTLKMYQKQLKLNDWAMYLLVERLAKEIYAGRDEALIYEWFLLTKLGYDVKIALSGGDVYLLHYVKGTVYGVPRYKFGQKYYYILSSFDKNEVQRMYTYDKKYPKADKALDFSLETLPHFVEKRVQKQRTFTYENNLYTMHYTQNKNLIDFMRTYPQVDYSIYFNAKMDMQTYKEIATQVKTYCDERKMADALNFMLHFIQKSFEYKRDDAQFGSEKVMFADETLFYDASDCEDRAILYAKLVQKLFGIDVIGVKYSDHFATALSIPMAGESVFFGSKRYVIADPTYINANIGEAIPKYRSLKPQKLIHLEYK
jgi:hypothetical protein